MTWLAAIGLINILLSTPIFLAIYNNTNAFTNYCRRKVKIAHICDLSVGVALIIAAMFIS